jgi:hypothetical protein
MTPARSSVAPCCGWPAKKYLDWPVAPQLRKKAIAKIASELARLQ